MTQQAILPALQLGFTVGTGHCALPEADVCEGPLMASWHLEFPCPLAKIPRVTLCSFSESSLLLLKRVPPIYVIGHKDWQFKFPRSNFQPTDIADGHTPQLPHPPCRMDEVQVPHCLLEYPTRLNSSYPQWKHNHPPLLSDFPSLTPFHTALSHFLGSSAK